MMEVTDVKPGDKVSFPAGGEVSTGTVEKVKLDGVGGSSNHTSDAAKAVEQESPEVLVTHGATTVVKPISEVEPEKSEQNHAIKFSASPATSSKDDKKDERDHVPHKNEHGIAPKDGLNGTARARSKSPAVIPPPPVPKDNVLVDKKPEEPKVVDAIPAPIVEDKPAVPVAIPPVPPVVAAPPAVPAAPAVVTAAPVPEPAAPPPIAVPPPVAAIPPVAAVPPAPVVAAPVPAPAAAVEPEPPKPAEPVKPVAPAEPVPKKPGPKPKAPKKERPPKRAATETGEPRRSKRNKPS